MDRAIFLDRDGVLIENRAEYIREWSHVHVFPKALQALAHLDDYKIVIVTNQSAIGRGLMSQAIAHEINNQLVQLIRENNGRIDGVYMCPHAPGDRCHCRKPNP